MMTHPVLKQWKEADFSSNIIRIRRLKKIITLSRDKNDINLFNEAIIVLNEENQRLPENQQISIDDKFYDNEPRVIVVKEKHGEYYLNAINGETMARSLLGLIKKRLKENIYYEDKFEDGDEQLSLFGGKPEYTPKQEAEMIVEHINKHPMELMRAGKLAHDFLIHRSRNCEYEEIQINKMIDLKL